MERTPITRRASSVATQQHQSEMSSKPVVVFVPGAWHKAEHLHLVIDELEAAGYETKAVRLASGGAPEQVKDFQPDVEAIRTLGTFVDQGKDVLIFVHSYGGIVGSEAVQGFAKSDREKQGKKGGVSHLYFCCAFVLPEGVSLMDALDNKPLPWFQINDTGDIFTPKTPIEILYNDVKEPEKYVDMLEPFSYSIVFSKGTYAGWKYVPCTYLLCEKDMALSIQAQKGMVEEAQQAGADMKVDHIDASHSPFLSMPGQLVRSIRKAAGEEL